MGALNEPEGISLVDFYTQAPVGLNLKRFGGFYWKFVKNDDWIDLTPGDKISFVLEGNNWLTSSSDIFNNWVFICLTGDCGSTEPKERCIYGSTGDIISTPLVFAS